MLIVYFFFFQAEDGIRDVAVTGVQTCALPISSMLPRNMFESSIDGQKNKRGVDVREHQHDGERAVKEVANRLAGEVQILQEAIQHAVAAKNGFPSIAAHKVADPKRHDD